MSMYDARATLLPAQPVRLSRGYVTYITAPRGGPDQARRQLLPI